MARELFCGYTRDTGMDKCAMKIDLHKAFDSLNWDFIEFCAKENFLPNL